MSLVGKLVRLGNENFSEAPDLRINQLTNQLLLISAVTIIFSLAGHVIIGYIAIELQSLNLAQVMHWAPRLLFPQIFLVLLIFICFYLKIRSKNAVRYAAIPFVVALCVTSYLSILFGKDAGIFLSQYILLLMPFMLIGHMSKPTLIMGIATSILTIAGVHFYVLNHPPMVPMTDGLTQVIFFSVILVIIAFSMSCLFYLAERNYGTEKQLSRQQNEINRLLDKVIPELESSKARYAHLVEDSPDVIFTLDENFTFTSVNKRVRQLLRFSPEQLQGMPFLNLIFVEQQMSVTMVQDALDSLQDGEERVFLSTRLRMRGSLEPVEAKVSLEASEINGKQTVLGRISGAPENKIKHLLTGARASFLIDNYLQNASIISQRLVNQVENLMPLEQVIRLRIWLNRLLVAAIEHGNLHIDHNEKKSRELKGDYLSLIKQRQRDPRFRNLRIFISFRFDHRRADFRIKHQGDGGAFAEMLDDPVFSDFFTRHNYNAFFKELQLTKKFEQ